MSIHERLTFKPLPELHEELMVTPYADGTDEPRAVAVPRPKDLALALAGATDEWFGTFLAHLHLGWPNRALAVARTAERMGLQHLGSDPVAADVAGGLKSDLAHEKALSDLAAAFGISQDDLVGTVLGSGWQLLPAARAVLALSTDVTGGDCDPGFGVCPEDSARLLELCQAIDAIGWRGHADEERGDYLERLKQIREELAQGDSLAAKNMRLQKQVLQQRAELRRFNRDARVRAETSPRDQHDRWLQKLHELETKEALGTANQADFAYIARLKFWMGMT